MAESDPGSKLCRGVVAAAHRCVTITSTDCGKPSGRASCLEPMLNLSASSRVRVTMPAIRYLVPLGVNSSPKTTFG